MMQNITKLLVKAVKEKRAVAIRYRKQKEIRVIEPHAIYTNDRGEVVVDGFQVRGYSDSGKSGPFWRPFRVKKISAISVLKEEFYPRVKEGFSTEKSRYRTGLLAMVELETPLRAFVYSSEALQQMGPFLPGQGSRPY
ncbi:MAG: WYL domain-containing protein [Gammaproteobacteria bacterium]|nr:WYL domain-containing protein [Gammaproteobacteria bacterium]